MKKIKPKNEENDPEEGLSGFALVSLQGDARGVGGIAESEF